MNRINPTNESFDVSKEEFNKLFDHAVEFSNSLLSERRQSIAPQLFVLTCDKQFKRKLAVIVIAGNFNDCGEKSEAMGIIGKELANNKLVALAAVLMSEAWISAAAIKEDVMPREASDKTECIVIAGMSIGKEHIRMRSQPVARTEKSEMVRYGEPSHDTDRDEADKPQAEFPLLAPFFREHLIQWASQLSKES